MKKTKENDEVNKNEIDTKNKREELAEKVENDVIENVEIDEIGGEKSGEESKSGVEKTESKSDEKNELNAEKAELKELKDELNVENAELKNEKDEMNVKKTELKDEKNELNIENAELKNKKNELKSKDNCQNNNEKSNSKNPEENSEKNTEEKSEKKKPHKNKFLKILGKIVSAILWIVVILALAVLIMTVTSKRTSIFGYRMYLIMSGSMEPTIHVRDAIITKEIDTPQTGDVIAFENGGIITVHRIIQEYTEGDNKLYQTKGDNNSGIDSGLVQKSQVKGKVICNMPLLGRTVLYLQSHVEILFLLIGVIIIIAIAKILIGRLM